MAWSDPNEHAAATLLRAAASLISEAHSELARVQKDWTDEDYNLYNKRLEAVSAAPLLRLAYELDSAKSAGTLIDLPGGIL